MKNLVFLIVFVMAISGCKEEPSKFEQLDYLKYETDPDRLDAFNDTSAVVELSCTNIPSLEEVKNQELVYRDKFYTQSQAIKAGIPLARVDYTKNISIYVRDYSRYKSCLASDGKSTINYGQVIRTVIELEDFDASAGIDLASIAASGTMRNKRQSYYLYKNGFFNPQIDSIIATVSGKAFDVENYSQYQRAMTEMIRLLNNPQTTMSVNKIGIEVNVLDEAFLFESPIVAYTLARIVKGDNCNEIKEKFANDSRALESVSKTINSLEMKCDSIEPTEEIMLKAKRYLQGIKVR
jgi:hypothetical protein